MRLGPRLVARLDVLVAQDELVIDRIGVAQDEGNCGPGSHLEVSWEEAGVMDRDLHGSLGRTEGSSEEGDRDERRGRPAGELADQRHAFTRRSVATAVIARMASVTTAIH